MMYYEEEQPGSADTAGPLQECDGRSSSATDRQVRFTGVVLSLMAAQAVLIFTVLLVPQSFFRHHAWLLYLVHYCLFLPFLFASRDRCAFLLSPSFLIISYVSLSFVIGSYAFSRGYVISRHDLVDFFRWEHYQFSTVYFMVCNILALFAYFLAKRRWSGQSARQIGGSLHSYGPHLLVGGILLVVGSVVCVGFSFLGGSGNFAIVGRTFGALVVALALLKAQWRYRFLAYVGILLLFAASEFMNRRVVLLLAFSFVFMEAAHLRDLRPSLKSVLLCIVVLAAVVILQMTMTIARGLNGFKGSYLQTFGEIGSFVGLDNVIAYSFKQTEGPATFFHSNNAVHFILEDGSLLRYGSTFTKVLFIAVPRTLWPDKPRSMVEIYTSTWNPAFRRSGCSTGINLYAECFWNFHVLGAICTVLILYGLNRVFFFYLSKLRAGNIWPFIYIGVGYTSLLMYARGHGLYSLAIDVGLAFIIQWVMFNPFLSTLTSPKYAGVARRKLPPVHAHKGGIEVTAWNS